MRTARRIILDTKSVPNLLPGGGNGATNNARAAATSHCFSSLSTSSSMMSGSNTTSISFNHRRPRPAAKASGSTRSNRSLRMNHPLLSDNTNGRQKSSLSTTASNDMYTDSNINSVNHQDASPNHTRGSHNNDANRNNNNHINRNNKQQRKQHRGGAASELNYKEAQELTKVLKVPEFQKPGTFSEATWRQMAHLLRSLATYHTAESVDSTFRVLERLLVEQEYLLQNNTTNTKHPTNSDDSSSIVNSATDAASPATASPSVSQPSVVKRLMSEKERRELQVLSRELLNTDLLNDIVQAWRKSWKQQLTNTSPMKILPLLEEFIDRSPSFHPDTKTYNMIMDAATNRFEKKVAVVVANHVFERMTNKNNNTPNTDNITPPKGPGSKLSVRFDTTPSLNGKLRCRNDISPDEYTYATLIKIYADAGDPKAAEEINNQLYKDFMAGKTTVQPSVRTFTACVSAWARSGLPQAPEEADRVVERMKQLDDEGTLLNVAPNLVTYNNLIECWTKSKRRDAAEHCENVLKVLETSRTLQPDRISYNTVIYAWVHVSKQAERAEAVLRRMYQSYKSRNASARPDLDSYHYVLEGLMKTAVNDDQAPLKAQMYLKRIKSSGLTPNLRSYNLVLACWARSNAKSAGGCAEALLREMKAPPGEHSRYAPVPVKPNSMTYTNVINAYAENGHAKQAEMIFRAMYKEYHQGNTSVKPKLQNFNAVLSAWTKSKSATDDERVKAMVNLMQKLPKTGPIGIKPDIISANTLLNCLAKSSLEQSRQYAESLLSNIEADYEATKDSSLRPDKYTYTSVMKAHANVGDVYKTKETLHRMIDQYKKGNEAAKPDIFPFNNVLLAIARGAKGRNENAGLMADEVFQEMSSLRAKGILDLSPNLTSYTMKIACWAASGDPLAGEEADSILGELEQLAANGQPEMKPDARVIGNVINAHAKCGNYIRSEGLLKQMLDDYSNGDRKMKPALETINMVLASLARANTPEAAEKAELYLQEMLEFQESESSFDLKPDAVTFTTVISAWVNSGSPIAAERVKTLFRKAEMLSQSADSQVVLDGVFYRSVIRACAQSGDISVAESLLQDIVKGDERDIQPDLYMYHALLEYYSKSDSGDTAEKAEALLKQMQKLAEAGNDYLKPDSACYRYVLQCWVNNANDVKMAADRSEALLREMEQRANNGEYYLKPDPDMYSM